MKRLIYRIDKRINLVVVLFLFWALFWGLNGGDKFFNGEYVVNEKATMGVLVDPHGNTAYKLHPMETVGLYGVNRNSKMITYFEGIHLPKEVALMALYGFAVIEIILGLMFLALFFWSLFPEKKKDNEKGMFADRTVHRLAFKGSILVFVFFSVGDILFGDRAELWEHGTFIVLCLITYDMWYRTDLFLIKMREKAASNIQEPFTSSTRASSYQ